MYYAVNYGFIKGVTAPDGASQAAYISGVDTAMGDFTGKIIAVVHRYDDIAQKLAVSPADMSYAKEDIAQQIRFQEQHFPSETRMYAFWGNFIG